MNEPATYDVKIYRNTTWREKFVIEVDEVPIDYLDGPYTAECELHPNQDGHVDIQVPVVLGADGSIVVELDPSETSAIAWEDGSWDIETTDPTGHTERKVQGLVTVRD